jgi:hypothetical protein
MDGQADRTRLQPPGQPDYTHQSLRLSGTVVADFTDAC